MTLRIIISTSLIFLFTLVLPTLLAAYFSPSVWGDDFARRYPDKRSVRHSYPPALLLWFFFLLFILSKAHPLFSNQVAATAVFIPALVAGFGFLHAFYELLFAVTPIPIGTRIYGGLEVGSVKFGGGKSTHFWHHQFSTSRHTRKIGLARLTLTVISYGLLYLFFFML